LGAIQCHLNVSSLVLCYIYIYIYLFTYIDNSQDVNIIETIEALNILDYLTQLVASDDSFDIRKNASHIIFLNYNHTCILIYIIIFRLLIA
jgi:hypothetical protein